MDITAPHLKDRADRNRELLSAALTLPDALSDGALGLGFRFQLVRFTYDTAMGTYGAIGPPFRLQVFTGRVGIAEVWGRDIHTLTRQSRNQTGYRL